MVEKRKDFGGWRDPAVGDEAAANQKGKSDTHHQMETPHIEKEKVFSMGVNRKRERIVFRVVVLPRPPNSAKRLRTETFYYRTQNNPLFSCCSRGDLAADRVSAAHTTRRRSETDHLYAHSLTLRQDPGYSCGKGKEEKTTTHFCEM